MLAYDYICSLVSASEHLLSELQNLAYRIEWDARCSHDRECFLAREVEEERGGGD